MWDNILQTTNLSDTAANKQLVQALCDWWEDESSDWDALVEGTAGDQPSDEDLWNCMPVVDSKAVARTAAIFEKYLGRRLDVRFIRPGGYRSLKEMICHLVPKMSPPSPSSGRARAAEQVLQP